MGQLDPWILIMNARSLLFLPLVLIKATVLGGVDWYWDGDGDWH